MKLRLLTAVTGLMLLVGSFALGAAIPGFAPEGERTIVFDMSGFYDTVPVSAEYESVAETEEYTVKAAAGELRLYNANGEELLTVDCSLSAMPEEDREKLIAGMVFATREEALEMIENFAE
ncbi:MAG: hypothetical protein LBM98_08360 [Oscillospiraceae bacterium]|jgi:hypothetical protein|nr:hypothetical protein [Oscillospiraceae bacterium]